MAEVTLVWTRPAIKDLCDAYDYIHEERPSAARRVIERLEKSLQALSRHPYLGRPGRVAGTREHVIPGTPFIIPYWVQHETIELLALIHTSRRWPDSL